MDRKDLITKGIMGSVFFLSTAASANVVKNER